MIGCDNDECPYQWVSTHFIAFLCLFAFESGTFTFTDPHEHLFSNYTGAYLPIGLPFRFASIPEASAFSLRKAMNTNTLFPVSLIVTSSRHLCSF